MAKDLQRAIDASVKASEAHSHLDQKMYMSAKHLESAAFFAKDLKRPDEAARLYEEAASFHQMDGEYGAAAEDLAKGGRALEGHDNDHGGRRVVRVRARARARARVRVRARARVRARVVVNPTCHDHGGRLMVSACENIEQVRVRVRVMF